jgi:hypothetical protein
MLLTDKGEVWDRRKKRRRGEQGSARIKQNIDHLQFDPSVARSTRKNVRRGRSSYVPGLSSLIPQAP